ALRHQLTVFQRRTQGRTRLTPADRAPVGLARAFVAGGGTGADPREGRGGRPRGPSVVPPGPGAGEPARRTTAPERSRYPGAHPEAQPGQSTMGDAPHR